MMLNQFQIHFQNSFPSAKGKRILLAVSGGIDSMVLLDLFQKSAIEIAVLHCNFQLRGEESDQDEQFLATYCKSQSIDFYAKKMDTQKYADQHQLSIQLAARQLRYEWFYEQLTSLNYDYIATAHHLDDSLETFLINLSRGTGLDGLLGIPAINNKVIRPLLPFSREQIVMYASEIGLKWREDASNKTTKYLRNKFRHDVIPKLKEIQPKLLFNFKQTINHLKESQSIILDAVQHFKNKVIIEKEDVLYFDCNAMMQFSNFQNYLYQILSSYGFSAWDDIYGLIEKQSGKQVMSENYVLLKDRNTLILFPKKPPRQDEFLIQSKSEIVKIPLNISFCNIDHINNTSSNCIFVDEDKLKFPLSIRKCNIGDTFFPFGMKGTKKVSKFFKDQKISILDKNNTWILCSDNRIVWIIGMRMDDRFKVTNETKKILKLELNL
jgi:tRNA(Ile)-lysidine synthase